MRSLESRKGNLSFPRKRESKCRTAALDASFRGMTDGRVDRQISALLGRESACCENGETKMNLSV
jgi:hypothetical protein